MAQQPPATTILEYLTAPNPQVRETTKKYKTNTEVVDPSFPAQIVEWRDFNLQTLKDIWDGDLFGAACLDRQLPSYPRIKPCNLWVEIEDDAAEIIHSQSKVIVQDALELVGEDFQPSVWSRPIRIVRGPPSATKTGSTKTKTNPGAKAESAGKSKNKIKGKGKGKGKDKDKYDEEEDGKKESQAGRYYYPDSSAITYQEHLLLSAQDSESREPLLNTFEERLPKEYKLSEKWRAADVINNRKILNSDGEWIQGAEYRDKSRPVKQGFTYCLATDCRYGCILSCSEMMLFRIGLRGTLDGIATERGSEEYQEAFREAMKKDGLMEYILVPWANNYTEPNQVPPEWTVNLALWFLHILAGQSFRIDHCSYPLLVDQPRPARPARAEVLPSNAPGIKRGRDIAEDNSTPDLPKRRKHARSGPRSSTDGSRTHTPSRRLDDGGDGLTRASVPPSTSSAVTAPSGSSVGEDYYDTTRTEVEESSSVDSRDNDDDDDDNDKLQSSFRQDIGLGPNI